MKAIIVDDQIDAIKQLEFKLSKNCPDIQILSHCLSIEEAYQKINELKPDLVFLDIDLGENTSFELLNLFREIFFKIIFVTGHDDLAIKAIKYAALGYIVKPVTATDLIEAVENVKKNILNQESFSVLKESVQQKNNDLQKIVLPLGNAYEVVTISEISYLEADRNYTLVYLIDGKKILVNMVLKSVEELLPVKLFFRVHKSFVVNISYIARFTIKKEGGYINLKNGAEVPVSDSKKQEVSSLIQGLSQ